MIREKRRPAELAGANYAEQAEQARREAQIAQEEADVSEGFRATELLDKAAQLRERAERLERYAAQ